MSRAMLTRIEIENEIERLISVLDAMEPDPDLEPYLGAPERISGSWWAPHHNTDERETDEADDEPSLGAPNVQMPPPLYRLGGGHGHCLFPMHREGGELTYCAAGFSQTGWTQGPDDDREDEHDGAEPCCEDEGAQCDDEGAQWALS